MLEVATWPGREPALVLLHGAGGNALWWEQVSESFSDRLVLAVDMPGHGQSPPPDSWKLRTTSEQVLEAIGARTHPAIFCGHSWGGKVALQLAATHPDRCSGLILMDPSPISSVDASAQAIVERRFGAELTEWRTHDDAVAAVKDLPQYRNWQERMLAPFLRGIRPTPGGGYSPKASREVLIELATQTFIEDLSADAERVVCPTLLIISEEVRDWQESNAALLPQAAVEYISANHWMFVDNAADTISAMRNWMKRVGV